MNKKLLSILLALAMAGSLAFGLTACGDNGDNTEETVEEGQVEENNGEQGEEEYDDETPDPNGLGLEYTRTEDRLYYTVTGIGTFSGEELSIPATYKGRPVVGIGNKVFWYKGTIKNVSIPDTVKTIEREAFRSCTALRSVVIGNGVESIGDYAFYGCSALKSLTIGSKVNTIAGNSFRGCTALENIVVFSGNEKYFSSFNSLIEVDTKTLILGSKNSVIIGGGSVTAISDYAFANLPIVSIEIPAAVTSIGDYAFEGCNMVEAITVESGNGKYSSSGNCLIEKSTATLMLGCKNSVIPADGSVTALGTGAFAGCIFESVTIPVTVTSLGDYVFRGCRMLTEINYGGTQAQWKKVEKGNDWDKNTGEYTINYSDGN